MKKIGLNLDELQVESFATAAAQDGSGTVRANSWVTDTEANPSDLGDAGCSAFNTCLDGCGGGNPNSGWNTCGNGSACTLGYTNWHNCTQYFKLCGY
jgi:hypothetical protein